MKRISALVVVLTLMLTGGRKYPDGWQYTPLPRDDEYATNRFGRSWLEPVYNGYLIVGDRYIDAPYVVEQRGFVIFVNNQRVDDGTDIRLVSPIPPAPTVTMDPGSPTNLNVHSTLDDVFNSAHYISKNEYWNTKGLYGQERYALTVEYLNSLPCVRNIVDMNRSVQDDRLVTIYDNAGNSNIVALQTSPRKPMATATDPEIYGEIVSTMGSRCYQLNGSSVLHVRDVNNPCIPGGTGAVWDTNKWLEVFATLTANLTVSQRLERIRAAEVYGAISDHAIKSRLPMNGFVPTPQLWKRLSGDTSWTNDAPARLLALTNGWQKIEPAFMRTQMMATATLVANVERKPTVSATESNPPPRVRPLAEIEPKPEHGPSGSSTIHWRLIAGLAILAIGLVFVYKRVFRQR